MIWRHEIIYYPRRVKEYQNKNGKRKYHYLWQSSTYFKILLEIDVINHWCTHSTREYISIKNESGNNCRYVLISISKFMGHNTYLIARRVKRSRATQLQDTFQYTKNKSSY